MIKVSFARNSAMKPMIWQPEQSDKNVNEYLDQINHAPYALIVFLGFGLFCLATLVTLVGGF